MEPLAARMPASSISTFSPALVSTYADMPPAAPEPTTKTSYSGKLFRGVMTGMTWDAHENAGALRMQVECDRLALKRELPSRRTYG